MERRSARGSETPRRNDSVTTPAKGPASGTKAGSLASGSRTPTTTATPVAVTPAPPPRNKPGPKPKTSVTPASVPVSAVATPVETSGDDSPQVLLNRRGVPARQIKRNRFYYDGDNVNDDTEKERKQMAKMSPKKVKQEPMEVEEEDEDIVQQRPGGPPPLTPKPRTTGSRPTPDAMARALTQLVKYPKGKTTTPTLAARQVQQQKPGASTPRRGVEPASAKKAETPKAKQTPMKISGPSPRGVAGPSRGHQTPAGKISRPDTPKSAGKAESRSAGKADSVGKPDRYGSTASTSAGHIKIKKEKDDMMYSTDAATREEKMRMKKEKERMAREKERRDFRREKDDEDDFGLPTMSKARGRRRSSINDSFTDNLLVLPSESMADVKPTLDKKTAQEISLRLRNLLKLPKAHKWVCYEWFYSNIDKVLFEGENDFQTCFRESFPQLKARKLTRTEWTKIRRLMGKPRRCSQSFFDEEREELSRRRQKIRMIQQRKVTDFNYKELPDEIPLQLVIGTKVTSRLRRPQDGLFTGTIDGVDTSNNTYRITFDRPGLGTHSIPDYEVLSNDQPETVSTSSFALKIPRRNFGAFSGGQFKFQNSADENGFPKSPFPVDGMLGGFPIRLLDMIVRLSKLLKAKREKILQLKELNVEAEKMRSYGKYFNSDFRTRYARCVLDLSSMNKEMKIYLDGVEQYCLEIAPDHGANQMIIPEHIQEHCNHEASVIVQTCNAKPNRGPVAGTKALDLITKLASMMLQVKTLSSGDRNLYELKSIKDSLKDVKATLEGKNVQLFQDRIEIPMNRIQAGLTMSGGGHRHGHR